MTIMQSAPVDMEKSASVGSQDGLPEEVRLELTKGNLVRAAHLANEKGVRREKVRELQLDAIRHFIEQLHNFEGAKELVSCYGLGDDEVRTILKRVLENPKSHIESITWFNRRKGRMVATNLAQRIQADPIFGK